MSRSASPLLFLCLVAAVALLFASLSPTAAAGPALSSSSSAPATAQSTGVNWYAPTGLSSSSSAPVQAQSTGMASGGRWNASSCGAWFASAVAPRCGLANLTSTAPFCSLGCAAVYGEWFNGCVNNAGPLFPEATGQYMQLAQLNNGTVFAAMNAMLANCSTCNRAALQPLYTVCGVNQTQSAAGLSSSDPLYTMQFPATCPMQCAMNYSFYLLPLYSSCIAPYASAAMPIPPAASSFLQQCAPVTAPSVVTGLTVLPLSASQVAISWSPATVVKAPTDGVVQYSVARGFIQTGGDLKPTSANGSFVQQFTFSAGNRTQALDATVSGGTTYVYGVVACNSVGCSPLSVLVSTMTPLPPPMAPAMVNVSGLTATSATVMWQASQPVVGDNSTLFYVLSRQLFFSSMPPAGLYRGANTSFTFNDLQPNTTYALSVVAASYAAGQSLTAATANFTTPFAAPSSVVGLTASSVSLANIRLQWSPPMQTGAWAIVYYTVWLANAGSATLVPLGNSTTGAFDTASSAPLASGLSVLTAYKLFVTATNTGGLTSAFTASVTATTPANAPNVTNALKPTLSPMGGTVLLSWNQSADINNGGSPITAVHLSLTSALDSREFDLPASAQQLNVSGLNSTAQYSVTWRAMNAYGWSANGPAAYFLTKSAAPSIVSFTAGDNCQCSTAFGVNSTLAIRFSTAVQGGNISTQAAVDALFTFIPAIPGSYVGQWTNGGSVAVITLTAVNSSAPAYTIGLVTVLVKSDLFDTSNKSSSAIGAMSSPLSGSWYQAPRAARFFGVNQTNVMVQQDSALNPVSIIPAPAASGSVVASTAVLTLSVLYGTLAVAKTNTLSSLYNASLAVDAVNAKMVILTLPYSTLSAALMAGQVTYTPAPLSTATDVLMASVVDVLATGGNPADSVNIAILISPVNHAPSIRFNSSVLPAWVFGSSYVLPAIVVSDVDSAAFPSASLSVVLRAQSVTALLSVSGSVAVPSTVLSSVQAGGSAPSLTLSGPLADLNSYLAGLPVSLADSSLPPSSTAASLQLFVNDNGNGGGGPLTFSANAPVAVTCAGTAAPAVSSAAFANDAGSLLLTFSAPLDQSATTSTDCAAFFDATTTALLGANPSCPFRGATQLAVVLGFGATLLPGQNLTFSASPAIRRCAGGANVTGSVTVQPPATTATPVVSISGPSTVSSCDSLTLYGQATGLGGRPAAASYSWSVALGSSSDPTLATASNSVLGSNATSAKLTVSGTALYNPNTYYFFYLTVSNFLGASNTSSIVVYKSALALPILQPQGSSALTVAANSPFFIAVTPVLSSCLSGDNRVMNFNWTIDPPVANMPPSGNPQINVPAFTLAAGSSYTFTLSGVMAVDATLASSAVVTVSVPASPIGVSITGGSVQQSSQLVNLTLSAVGVDPDTVSMYGNWSFAWSCLSSAGVACLDNELGTALSTAVPASNLSSTSLTIAAGKLAADVYTWSVVATNGARTAMSSVSVSVVANPIPIVSIASYLTIINPSGLLYYAASASDVTNTPLTFLWSQVSGPALNLQSVAVSLKTATLVLNNQAAAVFTAGATYSFQCVVVNGFNQSSFAQVSVTINAPPFGGSLSVSPSSGYAFDTSFALTADGWQSSTGSALSYQFFAVAADSSLTQLNVRSGAGVFNTQLAQGLTANVTVLVVVTDALGATSTYSAAVAVAPPAGLANDTTGSVFNNILASAATSASQTSNVGQLFGTLNALQDSIYLALLSSSSQSQSGRRLLGFTATSVPSYVTQLNTAAQTMVADNGAQTDITTLANTAIKQTSQTRATTADSVLNAGQSIIATLVAASQSLPTSSDQAKQTAQTASSSIIQLAGQHLAVIQLASTEANISAQTAQTATTLLLNNISAQCDSLSATSLNVAGQLVSITAGSAISVFAGCDAVSDSARYAFTAIDNTTVTFPAYSMAGAQTVNGSALSNSSSQLLDSRVFYMPDNLYVWAVHPMTAMSPVVYAARVSTDAEPLAAVGVSVVTMVISLPVATASCPAATCRAVCAVWDGSQSLWNSSSARVSTGSVRTVGGQSFIDCSVYGATAASAAVMAVNNSAAASDSSSSGSQSSSMAPALSSSSSSAVRLSSSSAMPALSSSSAAAFVASSSSSSQSALLYPSGSLQLAFYLTVSAGVNVSSGAFVANLTSSIASDLAGFYNLTTAQMLQYVEVVSVTVGSSTRRRLLQAASTAHVDFVIYSTISSLGVAVGDAANQFAQAAAAGTLTAPYGSTIPPQTVSVVDANGQTSSSSGMGGDENPPSDDSSSTPLALGLGLGLGIPALIVIVALIYFFAIKGGSAPVANGMLHQRLPAGSTSQ